MRRQQRMTRRIGHACRERTGRLGIGRDRLVSHNAGSELNAIHIRTSAGTSSASPDSARRRSSATVRASKSARANPCAAPTSESASQGMTSPTTIHPRSPVRPSPVGPCEPPGSPRHRENADQPEPAIGRTRQETSRRSVGGSYFWAFRSRLSAGRGWPLVASAWPRRGSPPSGEPETWLLHARRELVTASVGLSLRSSGQLNGQDDRVVASVSQNPPIGRANRCRGSGR